MSCVLSVMVVAWVFLAVKTHETVQFEWMPSIECKSDLNKDEKGKK